MAKAAVNIIGAVSPATRATPRIAEVRIPGMAYGSTLVRIIVHLVAPNASELSRKPFGIERRDSSLAVITIGRTMKASVNQPASIETFQSRKITDPIYRIERCFYICVFRLRG